MNEHTPSSRADSERFYKRPDLTDRKRYKLLACEIMCRELCLLVAQSSNIIDVEFLPKKLHDIGKEKMGAAVQAAIDAVPADQYDAILLGYARCNDGLVGLQARDLPLVIPRAHDCITLFFGSRQAYHDYFDAAPGTYFRTSGWTERDTDPGEGVMRQLGLDGTFADYVAKYGQENAEYILQSLGGWEENYQYLAYINMNLPIDAHYQGLAEREAAEKGLTYRLLQGDMSLLQRLIEGAWESDGFLVIPPGKVTIADDDGGVMGWR